MSEPTYSLDRWLTIVAVALAAYAFGNLIGTFMTFKKCDDRMDDVTEMCLMTSNDAFNFCRETMDRMDDQCMNENPSAQQNRIYKWEECFRDENCRNCLLMTNEEWRPDVEFCFANALFNDEPLPEYIPPPDWSPPVDGPQL